MIILCKKCFLPTLKDGSWQFVFLRPLSMTENFFPPCPPSSTHLARVVRRWLYLSKTRIQTFLTGRLESFPPTNIWFHSRELLIDRRAFLHVRKCHGITSAPFSSPLLNPELRLIRLASRSYARTHASTQFAVVANQ